MYGLISRALHVRQLLSHFLISGVALGLGRDSQRRFRSSTASQRPSVSEPSQKV